MTLSWCVVQAQPLKEGIAKKHLVDQGYDVYLPMIKKTRRHARKVEEVLTPLFPGYLFVALDLKSSPWRSVNGTRGVVHLLMNNQLNPATVPSSIINDIKSRETEQEIVDISSLELFSKGEKVLIVDGIFKEYTAFFEAMDSKKRVHLLLNFMGREMNLSLPHYAVKAA